MAKDKKRDWKVSKKEKLDYKRYWLIMMDQYYPRGFEEDIKESFDTIQETLNYLEKLDYTRDHIYIFDSKTKTILRLSKKNGK